MPALRHTHHIVLAKQLLRQYSVAAVHRILPTVLPSPWMKQRGSELIRRVLLTLKPSRCLEWGAGYSTLYFPVFLEGHSSWLSVEHNGEWSERIRSRVQRSGVEVVCIPPNVPTWTGRHGDGSFSEFRDYVDYPRQRGPFDFILIDGRARLDCARTALELISHGGIVLMHDANREWYRRNLVTLPFTYQMVFLDYRNDAGGMWIGSQQPIPRGLFEPYDETLLWQLYEKLGRNPFGRFLKV